MLVYIIISIVLLSISFIGFAISILVKRNGSFPETSISKNKELRKRKIFCIKTEQKIIDKQIMNNDCQGNSCCSSW
jgi:hypothetical protein